MSMTNEDDGWLEMAYEDRVSGVDDEDRLLLHDGDWFGWDEEAWDEEAFDDAT